MSRSRTLAVVLVCLLATTLVAAATSGASPAARTNLLLVTLDTTRADYIGCYGFPLPTSPHLDAVARRGVRFANTYSQVPLTGPSHATILTGLFPHEHGAVRNGVPLPDGVRTLAEILHEAGYRTGAFLSGWTLRANLSGLSQGFDTYDDSMQDRYRLVNSQRFAHQVTPLAVKWLEENGRGDRPFFLWVHYFDPHAPYTKQHELYDALGHEKPEEMPDRNLQYASEIRHVDEGLGQVLAALDRLGRRDDTLVVIVGDHGESLGEHDYVGHGKYLYEEILRVPMVFSWPGHLPEGKTVEPVVAVMDVTPTVLGLLGEDPLPVASGVNLVPWIESDRAGRTPRQVRFEVYPGARKGFFKWFGPKLSMTPQMIGYREGNLKYVYHVELEFGTVYDLSADGEYADLSDRYPALAKSGPRLVEWVQSTAAAVADSELAADDAKRLKSLGY
jgi:arylsulfatase A-like enzyme